MDEKTLALATHGLREGQRIAVVLTSGEEIEGEYSGDSSRPVLGKRPIAAEEMSDLLLIITTAGPALEVGPGPHWTAMDGQPRMPVSDLAKTDIPIDPGVYAFYRDGKAVYVGKAKSLQDRVGTRHLGQSKSMHDSAFRRNVAESLRIASADDIYKKIYRLNPEELTRVRSFIEQCEVAWITKATPAEAEDFEDEIKDEWMPPLTKI